MCDRILHHIEAACYPFFRGLTLMQKAAMVQACLRDTQLTEGELLAKLSAAVSFASSEG